MEDLLLSRQKEFRTTGFVMFCVAAGLLIARIVASLVSEYLTDLALDALFTVLMQVVFLALVPFLIYMLRLNKTPKEVLGFSNVRKPNLKIMLLCIPLGILCLIVTIGVSFIWLVILLSIGYTPGSSDSPEVVNVGTFILSIFLTGVLPGLCEEFTNRGGFLTVMRGSFTERQTIVICGLAFGLFHQNITQVFYTFCFGMLMAFLVLKTKSIFPAVLVHFINNSISVCIDYAEYVPPIKTVVDAVDNFLFSNIGIAFLIWLAALGLAVGIVYLIVHIAKKERAKLSAEHNDGIVITAVDGEAVEQPKLPLEDKMLYKPVARDWAFYIGAIVITVLTTFCTLYWGL